MARVIGKVLVYGTVSPKGGWFVFSAGQRMVGSKIEYPTRASFLEYLSTVGIRVDK